MPTSISRRFYTDMFGATTGDRVRLADTDLIVEVGRDLTVYGEEVKFGGGKVIRDGMGQSQASRAEGAVDTVITNALILDWTGIFKADVSAGDKIPRKGTPAPPAPTCSSSTRSTSRSSSAPRSTSWTATPAACAAAPLPVRLDPRRRRRCPRSSPSSRPPAASSRA